MSSKTQMLRGGLLLALFATGGCASIADGETASLRPIASQGTVLLSGDEQPTANSLTLLGTGGGPIRTPDRTGSATLLRVRGINYLIDAGHGVVGQLFRAELGGEDIPLVFLTHLHDDHYAGLTGLASFGFTMRGNGLLLVGPPRTSELETALEAMMNISATIRTVENRINGTVEDYVSSREVGPGEVYRDERVVVTALENQHFRLAAGTEMARANRSLSYSFEFDGKRIVFTGDTGPFAGLTEFVQGADILIAEMASSADRERVPPHIVPHMDREHLSPTEVGRLAAAAGAKMLVLSHIGIIREADVAEIKRHFSGELLVGEDMMMIPFD